MKTFINRINQLLLERYPLIWTSRLVWVLLISLLIHGIFFLMGLATFRDSSLLQQYWGDMPYLHNGALLFSIICSILVLVIWLMLLFRHNGFKNFYPTSRWQLFGSFLIYFVIFFFVSGFFVSYILGYQTYIKNRFPATTMWQQRELSNLAAAFLSQDQASYGIDQRKSPSPFDSLYCETEEDQIDFRKPYLSRLNDEYQFYKVIRIQQDRYADTVVPNPASGIIKHQDLNDTLQLLWLKGEVVDLSRIATVELSYYNYSRVRFPVPVEHRGWGRERPASGWPDTAARRLNQRVQALLNRKDPRAVKAVMTRFLAIAAAYQIQTNLTTDAWMNLVDTEAYQVQHFIRNHPDAVFEAPVLTPSITPEPDSITAIVEPPAMTDQEGADLKNRFYQSHLTGYYFDTAGLETSFSNIEDIRRSSFWNFQVHLLIWLAFFLTVFLYIYRTSDLRSLLLTIIFGILLTVFTGLLIMLLQLNGDLGIYYLILIIGALVLLVPFLGFIRLRKNVRAVFINLGLAIIVPWLFLVLLIINQHQEQYYMHLYGDSSYYRLRPRLIIDLLGARWSYIFLILGCLCFWGYSGLVRKWRALPEG